MRVLLAIKSCARLAALENVQRHTFLPNCPCDYRFFRGWENVDGPDVVALDAPDEYPFLPFKTHAIARWTLDAGYDFAFLCDTDTYVRPERLLASGFERHDYTGFFSYDAPDAPKPPGSHHAYASGGSGYWLSRRGLELVAAATPWRDNIDPVRGSLRGEDLWVGWTIGDAGIVCHKDPRYRLYAPGPLAHNDTITIHDVRLDTNDRVPAAHRQWLASGGRP